MNQADFGKVGGVALNSQSRYETGKNTPTAEYLARLAIAGVDVHYVLTGNRTATDSLDAETSDALTMFMSLPGHMRQMARSVLRTMVDEASAPIGGPPLPRPPSVTVHEKKGHMTPARNP